MNEMKRTVCSETLAFLRGQITHNAEEDIIRTKYVYNLIDDLEVALSSNKCVFNWPFSEECVQESANDEMDAEDDEVDSRSYPESYFCDDVDVSEQRWHVMDDNDGNPSIYSTDGRKLRISFGDGITKEQIDVIAAAPEMLSLLEDEIGEANAVVKTARGCENGQDDNTSR